MIEETNDILIFKYRFRKGLVIFSSIFLTIFLFVTLATIASEPIFGFIMFLLSALLIWIIYYQIKLRNTDYHFYVSIPENQFIVRQSPKKKAKLQLSDLRGVAFSSKSYNGTQLNLIQFAVSPEVWSDFNNLNPEKKAETCKWYDEMYTVITDNNQKTEEILEMQYFLETKSGIPVMEFVPSVLNEYPGKIKEDVASTNTENAIIDSVISTENPMVKKQRNRQAISFFFGKLILTYVVTYFFIKFLGMVNGIYW